jgi:hypothetical protein
MLNKFLLLTITLLFFQCKSDNEVREQAQAEALEIAQAKTASNDNQATGIIPKEGLAPGQTAPTVKDVLTMLMEDRQVAPGERACLPVTAQGFQNLIGMQFSFRWNPEELTFAAVENMELVDLSLQNFGATYAEKGVVALSWIHQSLQGVSLPRDAHLFDICFTPKVASGKSVEVRFDSRPTPYEVINTQEEILQFSGVNGHILVK